MARDYVDFDLAIVHEGQGYAAHVVASPAGSASAPFALPFTPTDLAQFMIAVGPPRVASRRIVPATARVVDVQDYGGRLGDALLTGAVGEAFRTSLAGAAAEGKDLRFRLRLTEVPELEPVPWEYLYDRRLDRFLTLSKETPIVRLLDAVDRPPAVTVEPPLRVLVMISSPSDMPPLAVEREEQLLRATTGDLVASGQLELVVLEKATLTELQRALIDDVHVFHFVGHGGFDTESQEGVLVLERDDGTAHRVSGARLGTLLHDARDMQLAVLNACEGARTSGRDAFSGVAQTLVRQGLPAVVAMQTEISDRAALVFSHEFYWFLTRGLGIDAAMCEVRKAMAISDEASEWGTAVLLRSGSDQPFTFTAAATAASPSRERRLESLYDAAQGALAAQAPETALPMLEQVAAEKPDYADVTTLLEQVRPVVEGRAPGPDQVPGGTPDGPEEGRADGPGAAGTDAVPLVGGVADSTAPPRGPVTEEPADTPGGDSHPGEGRRRSTLALKVGAGALALALGGGIAWWQLGNDGAGGGGGSGGGTDAVVAACGPAVDLAAIERAIVASCTVTPPQIDGSFGEWSSVPSVAVDAQVFPKTPIDDGLAATWQTVWDRDALYVHAVVRDPVHRFVDESNPSQFWRGDAISFEFGPDARELGASAGLRNGQDRHVIVGLTADGAAASINLAVNGDFPAGGAVPAIAAARSLSDAGYEIEARVPWRELGVSEPPTRGAVFATNLNVSDAAQTRVWALRKMVSSNPQRTVQRRPAIWQPLVLGDPAGG